MRALTYHGKHDVRVETVPDPRIEAPTDVILRVTATAICGSDLHMYNGWMGPVMKKGDILGHEFMGVVEAVGAEVRRLKPGDRVIVPFQVACHACFFCERELYAACETTNPGPGGALTKKGARPPAALYGYSSLYGSLSGGQAEYVRVLEADANAFKVPDGLTDEQVLFLTDILPTGYQAVLQAGVKPGSSVAIVGAGPVGQMSALSARLLGAERIFMIDDAPDRLAFAAERYGAETINFRDLDDPAERIIEAMDRRGVDAAIDAVGFEAKGNVLEDVLHGLMIESGSGAALRTALQTARRGGTVSLPGVYVGFLHGFLIGDAFDKGLTFKMGQTHVHQHLDVLLEAIRGGRIAPQALISHRLSLEDAPTGYKNFANHEPGWRKVVLFPGQAPAP